MRCRKVTNYQTVKVCIFNAVLLILGGNFILTQKNCLDRNNKIPYEMRFVGYLIIIKSRISYNTKCVRFGSRITSWSHDRGLNPRPHPYHESIAASKSLAVFLFTQEHLLQGVLLLLFQLRRCPYSKVS